MTAAHVQKATVDACAAINTNSRGGEVTVFLPDPDIGRCRNHRFNLCSCGYSEDLRCLDYDNTPHVCDFPAPAHRCALRANTYTVQSPPTPKPWKKPT